jgi:hypothetical protein
MGGRGMPAGMEGDAGCGNPGAVCGWAAGALDTGPAPGRGSRRAVLVLTPGGRKEPGVLPMGCPGGAQQRQRCFGQGDGAVCGARAAVDLDQEARRVDVSNLEVEPLVEPESQAIDSGEVDLIVQGRGSLEQTSDFLGTEDGGTAVFGLHAKERQGVPGRARGRAGRKTGCHCSRCAWKQGRVDRHFCGAGRSPEAPVQRCSGVICGRTERADRPHGHRTVGYALPCH